MHKANNAFVKKNQEALMSKGIKAPRLDGKYMNFDACMTNNGEYAQDFAHDVTVGLDKEAFPVK
jgi:hypothetical protein